MDEIFEPQNGVYIVNNDNASSGNNFVKNQHIHYNIPEHVLDTMKKNIEKLENEIKELKEKANL